MHAMRRRLSWIAAAWLVCQVATAVSLSAAVCADSATQAATVGCTCTHADGGECPMHHTRQASRSPRCSCRSTDDDSVGAILSLLGSTAVPTIPQTFSPVARTARLAAPSPIDRPDPSSVPDSPPPRRASLTRSPGASVK
jgi:hypothetical protein